MIENWLRMPELFLLGPQRSVQTIDDALEQAGVRGPLCVITAGWQEREGELEELRAHAKRPIKDLRLYRLAEDIFERDSTFFKTYRERQERFKSLQLLYRRRLKHALAAAREIWTSRGDRSLVGTEVRSAIAAVRALDRHHRRRLQRIHRAFEQRWAANPSALVTRKRSKLVETIQQSDAVLIAGGHIAVLLNRLRLFDLFPVLATKPVIAWSAGAMALTEQIVLFHDFPPQGPGDAEVFDIGLGLAPSVVALPHARKRLNLDSEMRVGIFASRFAPARCLTLDHGSFLSLTNDGKVQNVDFVGRLTRTGRVQAVERT